MSADWEQEHWSLSRDMEDLQRRYEELDNRYDALQEEYDKLVTRSLELHTQNAGLWEVEKAAAYVIQLAILRNDPVWAPAYLAALNKLARLVPGTRDFERNPLR